MSKIIITDYNDRIVQILTGDDGRAVEIRSDNPEHISLVGNIYAGRVINISADMNAAFVEYEKGRVGYLHLDEKEAPQFLNSMRKEGPVRQGDIILVQIRKDAAGYKKPVLTGRLRLTEEDSSVLSADKDARGLLKGAPEGYITFIREAVLAGHVSQIITDISDVYIRVKAFLEGNFPEKADILSMYRDRSVGLGTVYGVLAKIANATDKRVSLRSGASIVIEHTEALVAIDVNTAKNTDRSDPESKFLEVNLEAAQEIARQIRLRNLSGIIIIDFINMKKEESRKALVNALKGFMATDPLNPVLIDMTPLGLVEITRKKVRRPLYETL